MINTEKETIIQWDADTGQVLLYTADAKQVARWTKLGYQVSVSDLTPLGEPRSWTATGPKGCVVFRRVKDGILVKRPAPGNAFLPQVQRPGPLPEAFSRS